MCAEYCYSKRANGSGTKICEECGCVSYFSIFSLILMSSARVWYVGYGVQYCGS